ncbi:hypothetical protein [Bacillus massiliglaciei]|uniref:hypothetical protein n=1 Tax=Bacillus massiliglaciei TaxID=1816693 RepID=UPI000DA63578|nr:hypothetical protein [Bacillus massiliglaciei]
MKKVLLITFSFIAVAGAVMWYAFNPMSKETLSVKETESKRDGGKMIEIKEANAKPAEESFLWI